MCTQQTGNWSKPEISDNIATLKSTVTPNLFLSYPLDDMSANSSLVSARDSALSWVLVEF